MSRSDIAGHLAEKFDLTKRQALEFLDELASLASSETMTKGEFLVPGIGKLVKQRREARTGRNPATGEPIEIAATTVVKFRVAKVAKDAIT